MLNATALIPGHAKLTISYDNGDIHLEASITISSYLPLRPVDPVSVSVVTLGSSKTMLVEGGPSPWVLDPSQFHKSCECYVTCASHHICDFSHFPLLVTAEQPEDLDIIPLPSTLISQHLYRILCRELGEQILTIEVGNGRTLKNSFPANETASIR